MAGGHDECQLTDARSWRSCTQPAAFEIDRVLVAFGVR
jgi:hypothetical protein